MPRLALSALIALLALLAVPMAASAKPPKLSPQASPVSAAGVATIEAEPEPPRAARQRDRDRRLANDPPA